MNVTEAAERLVILNRDVLEAKDRAERAQAQFHEAVTMYQRGLETLLELARPRVETVQ